MSAPVRSTQSEQTSAPVERDFETLEFDEGVSRKSPLRHEVTKIAIAEGCPVTERGTYRLRYGGGHGLSPPLAAKVRCGSRGALRNRLPGSCAPARRSVLVAPLHANRSDDAGNQQKRSEKHKCKLSHQCQPYRLGIFDPALRAALACADAMTAGPVLMPRAL
jgi:hypothetical protein